jgi:hypothetical protein
VRACVGIFRWPGSAATCAQIQVRPVSYHPAVAVAVALLCVQSTCPVVVRAPGAGIAGRACAACGTQTAYDRGERGARVKALSDNAADWATVLQRWNRALPQPLIPWAAHDPSMQRLVQLGKMPDLGEPSSCTQEEVLAVVQSLPTFQRHCLERQLEFMRTIEFTAIPSHALAKMLAVRETWPVLPPTHVGLLITRGGGSVLGGAVCHVSPTGSATRSRASSRRKPAGSRSYSPTAAQRRSGAPGPPTAMPCRRIPWLPNCNDSQFLAAAPADFSDCVPLRRNQNQHHSFHPPAAPGQETGSGGPVRFHPFRCLLHV